MPSGQNVYSLSTSLTDRVAEKASISSGSRPLYVRDTRLKGFGLAVTPHGTKSFFVETRQVKAKGGCARRVIIGRYPFIDCMEARKRALEALKQIKYGQCTQSATSAPRAILSLSELSREFISRKESVLRPSTIADYRMVLEGTYFESWKEVPVNEIARRSVLDQYQALCTRHGAGMANKAMRVLSATLNYSKAVYPELESWANPVRVLSETRSRVPLRPRTSHIKPEDLPKWLSALDAYRDDETSRVGRERRNDIWLFLHLILMTGLRSNEARSVMWSDIDLNHGVLTIPESVAKNHMEARLPLNSWLIAQLSNRERSSTGRVFPSSCSTGYLENVRRALKRIEKLSGMKVMPHDLRRTFATYLDQSGVPFGAIKQLLNHVSKADVTVQYIQKRGIEELRKYSEDLLVFITEGRHSWIG